MYLKFLRDKETDVGGVAEKSLELTAEEMELKISELESLGTAKDGENLKLKKDLETLQSFNPYSIGFYSLIA